MILMSFFIFTDSRSVTLTCDSIAKHIKSLKRCTLQPLTGADIWDIVYYIDAGIAKVTYDIIIIHVGTNNVCSHKLADFDYAYNLLITTVKRVANLTAVTILSAIIPRPGEDVLEINQSKT